MKKSLKSIKPRHVLIIQTAFIGDAIMSTPVIQAVCDYWPDTVVDVVTRAETAILFKHHPRIRRVYTIDKSDHKNKYESLMDLVKQIRPVKYNLAFSLQSSFTSTLLMVLSGIKIRIGFYRQKFLTYKVKPPKGLHSRQRYLLFMKPFTDKVFSDSTHLYISPEESEHAEKIFNKANPANSRIIGFAPGSVRETKKWPSSYWSELLVLLKDRGFEVVFIGSPSERELCESIILTTGLDAYNASGELNLLESAALIRKLDLLICNDSAPLHLGNAVNTPVFAFFGPTVKSFGCYPYREKDKILEIDLPCRPCGKHGHIRCPLRHFKCMAEQYPVMVSGLVFERFAIHDK